MNKVKAFLVDFFDTLSMYDYIGFIVVFIIFFLFIVLALLLRRRTLLSMILVVCSFFFLFGGPVLAHLLVQNSYYKSKAEITEVKQLYYSDTLILRGVLHFLGKKDATHCMIEASLYKKSPNILKDLVYGLKAYRSASTNMDKVLTYGDDVSFKIVIEPFNYKGDYNITVNSGCHK